jgi:hypothetical protein
VHLTWVTLEHVEAVAAALEHATSAGHRRRLLELHVAVAQAHAAQVVAAATALASEEVAQPLLTEDLDAVENLMTKGVLHNGLVPSLSAVEVAHGLAVLSSLLQRASVGTLSQEQRQLLEQVFDFVVTEHPADGAALRVLEQRVRLGLGLQGRVVWSAASAHPA